MKTSAQHNSSANRRTKKNRGFSLLELLMGLAVLSSVAAASYMVVSGTVDAAKAGKLQSDVVTINNAIRTYLVHGGTIPASDSADGVIARLKTTSDGASGARMAGLKGTMLDARLRGIAVTTPGPERAVWNPAKLRFEIQTAGTGFSGFDNSADPAAAPVEETRRRTMDLATKSKWIWDHSDSEVSRPSIREVATAGVVHIQPPPPPVITRLAAPDVSLPGALYDLSAFSPAMQVSLVDPNPLGAARLFYSVDNGPWQEYTGTPLTIPSNLTTQLRTYAAAVNMEDYEDSEARTETYETIYFTGISDGVFHSPAGDSRLLTNLSPGERSATFEFGDPATSDPKMNQLYFTGGKFTKVAPDQEFKLGELTYYNGTTQSGTNATSVEIAISLNLTTPGVKETLNFTFDLLSTPNHGVSKDADADFVHIPKVSTNFRTTIKGKQFALILRFGEHSEDGFTTIDTFHAHEGQSLRGAIYGRLSEITVP